MDGRIGKVWDSLPAGSLMVVLTCAGDTPIVSRLARLRSASQGKVSGMGERNSGDCTQEGRNMDGHWEERREQRGVKKGREIKSSGGGGVKEG